MTDTSPVSIFRANSSYPCIEAYLRKHGYDPATRLAVPMARMRDAAARGDCAGAATAARGFERESEAILVLARCDLHNKRGARAVSRLETMFRGVEIATAPTLWVRHELALGRAYVALGKHDRARRHLRRVVDLWKHARDMGEVGQAQRLLLKLGRKQ